MCFLTTTFRNAPAHPPPPVLIDQSLRNKVMMIITEDENECKAASQGWVFLESTNEISETGR